MHEGFFILWPIGDVVKSSAHLLDETAANLFGRRVIHLATNGITDVGSRKNRLLIGSLY